MRRGQLTLPRLEPLEDRTLLSFAAALNFAAGTDSNFVAIWDVNGDGKPDLVTANVNSNNSWSKSHHRRQN